MFFNIGDNVFHCCMADGTNDLSNKDVLLWRVTKSFYCLRLYCGFSADLGKRSLR